MSPSMCLTTWAQKLLLSACTKTSLHQDLQSSHMSIRVLSKQHIIPKTTTAIAVGLASSSCMDPHSRLVFLVAAFWEVLCASQDVCIPSQIRSEFKTVQ